MRLVAVRYLLPAGIVVLGIVFLVVEPNTEGLAGFISAVGAALAVLLLNALFRAGVAGDRDRDREEAARDYYDRHGYWPDERPRRPASEEGDGGEPRRPLTRPGGEPRGGEPRSGAPRASAPRGDDAHRPAKRPWPPDRRPR